MKTNGNLILQVVLWMQFMVFGISAVAQPDYVFKNAFLVSGTDKQIGARYLFQNVRPGTDAFVTITDIDKVYLDQLDGPSGFDEAFQPYVYCPKKTKGYVEFRFDFVFAGTTTPRVMLEVPVTAIDIDGYEFPDEKVFEFDEFKLEPGYYVDYNLLGNSLDIKYTANEVQAVNKSAITFDGIDTLEKDVMFTMVYANVSGITIRAGVDNKSKNGIVRLRSDYFKKFSYPNAFLDKPALLSLRGYEKSNNVELQWALRADHGLRNVIVEKASSPAQFQALAEVAPAALTDFRYTDHNKVSGKVYYRLKMITQQGSVQYSNILVFSMGETAQASFKVYPAVVQSSVTLQVTAATDGTALFRMVDYSGRTVHQQLVTLQQGNNNVAVYNLDNVMPGNYLVLLTTNDHPVYHQKVIKQ